MSVNIPISERQIEELLQKYGSTAAGALLLEELLSLKAQGQLTGNQALRLLQHLKQRALVPVELYRIASAIEFELRFTMRPAREEREKAIQQHFFANLDRYLPAKPHADWPALLR